MPVGPARMPLLDHLGELRRRLTIIQQTSEEKTQQKNRCKDKA